MQQPYGTEQHRSRRAPAAPSRRQGRGRNRRSTQGSLGVDWHLPGPDGAYEKRRFATTTAASSLLVTLLAEDGLTWAQIAEQIRYDDEARAVAARFVEAGYGGTPALVHLNAREAARQ